MVKPSRPTDVVRQIGIRLRAVREVEGLTQEAFARAIGVTETALGNWERGDRVADVLAMVRVLSRFGVTLEWIYAGHLRGMDFDYAEKLRERSEQLSNPDAFAPTTRPARRASGG
jgi:transcriptional regulator with XRE-family HTH domain